MVSKEQLLIDDLALSCKLAAQASDFISLAPLICEYAEKLLNEPLLQPILQVAFDQHADDVKLYNKLAKLAVAEIDVACKQIHTYIKNNDVLGAEKAYQDNTWLAQETGLDASAILVKNCYIKRFLANLAKDPTGRHLPFVKQLVILDDANNIVTTTYFSSYDNFIKEIEYLNRIRQTRIWNDLQRIFEFRIIFDTKVYDQQKEQLHRSKRTLSALVLSVRHQALDNTITPGRDNRLYEDNFDVVLYKNAMQKTYTYIQKKLLSTQNGEKVNWAYTPGLFTANGKIARFQKDKNPSGVLAILTKNNKNKRKSWDHDEVYKEVVGLDPEKSQTMRVYEACNAINVTIHAKTGIADFLIYDTSSCRINPDYLD